MEQFVSYYILSKCLNFIFVLKYSLSERLVCLTQEPEITFNAFQKMQFIWI